MNKNDIEKYIQLIANRPEVERINLITEDNFTNILKIHYTITKEYAKEHNLEFLERVFEYNPNILNLSHTREYAKL